MRVKFELADDIVNSIHRFALGMSLLAVPVNLAFNKPSSALIAAGTAWILSRVFKWK